MRGRPLRGGGARPRAAFVRHRDPGQPVAIDQLRGRRPRRAAVHDRPGGHRPGARRRRSRRAGGSRISRRRGAGRRADQRRAHRLRLGGRALRRRRPRQPDARSSAVDRRGVRRRTCASTRSACASRGHRLRRAEPAGRRHARRVHAADVAAGPRARLRPARLAPRAPVPAPLPLRPRGPHERVASTVRVAGLARSGAAPRTRRPRCSLPPDAPFHHSPARALWRSPGRALAIATRDRRAARAARCGCSCARGRVSAPSAHGRVRRRRRPEAGAARRTATLSGACARAPSARSSRRAWWPASWRTARHRAHRRRRRRSSLAVGRGRHADPAAALLTLIGGPPLGLLAFGVPLGARALIERRVRRAAQAVRRPAARQPAGDGLRDAGRPLVQRRARGRRRGRAGADAARAQRACVADERLGVPLDEALAVVVRRMESKDLEQVALVAALQRETGGNTAEVARARDRDRSATGSRCAGWSRR